MALDHVRGLAGRITQLGTGNIVTVIGYSFEGLEAIMQRLHCRQQLINFL